MQIGPNFNNSVIANRLNLSKEEMIAKYGEPGTTSPEKIASENNMTAWDLIGDTYNKPNENQGTENQNTENELIKNFLNQILEFLMGLIEKINNEKPEEENTEVNEAVNIFSSGVYEDVATSNVDNTSGSTTATTSNTSASTETSSSDSTEHNTQNDKYQEVANATGYDVKTVSAIMKAAATGNYTGAPEAVVPKMAYDLGLPQTVVADVLKYLNNGNI